MPGELAGPAFLSIILLVATCIALARRDRPPEPEGLIPAALLAIALQVIHLAEEFIARFHHRFPALLGLESWSDQFFLLFNLVWVVLWTLSVAVLALGRSLLPASILLWFLALAAMANALAHPALSLVTLDYFPGTVSALPLGAAGFLLARRLCVSG